MSADLLYIFYRLTRKCHKVLLNPQEHLTFDLPVVLAKKFEIRQESTGHRVLDCHHCSIRIALVHLLIKTVKSQALYNLRHNMSVLLIEKPRRLLMKAALYTLNRNFLLHIKLFLRAYITEYQSFTHITLLQMVAGITI